MCFDNFWADFNLLYQLHFPEKKVKINKNYHKLNAFMTKGLLISRRKKLELHKLSLTNPDRFSIVYKTYRNLYNSVLRASKKLYIENNFKKFQKNPKKNLGLLKRSNFWRTKQAKNR
jgi:hypothetical protein